MNTPAIESLIDSDSSFIAPAIYPSQKGIAYRLTYPKGVPYLRTKIGGMLIPLDAHAEAAADAIRRAYPGANSFRLYDETGELWFAGSL